MWGGHYFQFLDRWTPAMGLAPRWLAANGRPEVDDDTPMPAMGTSFASIAPTDSASGGVLPSSWSLTDGTPDRTGSLMEALVHTHTQEAEAMHPSIEALYRATAWGFDLNEPQFGWVVAHDGAPHTVEILTEGGWEAIPEADSDLGLFWSGGRRYRSDGDHVLIHGLDLLPLDTEVMDGWQFLPCPCQWNRVGPVFLEHPKTKGWIPLHSSLVREDGFLGYRHGETLRARVRSTDAGQQLATVRLRVDGVELTGRRVPITATLDERGLLVGVERLPGEDSLAHAEAVLKAGWFARRQDAESVRNYVSAALRTAVLTSVDPGDASLSLPAGATGFTILGEERTITVAEVPMSPDLDTRVRYRSLLADPGFGVAFLRDRHADFDRFDNGTYRLRTEVRNTTDRPQFAFAVERWTESATGAAFTDNWHAPEPIPALITTKVRVLEPSAATIRLALQRSAPYLRWRSRADEPSLVQGGATFD